MRIGTKMEQYLILAKSAKGKALEALISEVLGDNETWIFGELIESENIKAVCFRNNMVIA